jgi:hypothetical protein
MFEWLRYDQIKTFNICSAVFGTEIWPAVEYGRTTVHNSPKNRPVTHENAEEVWLVYLLCMQFGNVSLKHYSSHLFMNLAHGSVNNSFQFFTGKIETSSELIERITLE